MFERESQPEIMQERRLQHQLEIQSMQIEHVFNRHDLPTHVAGGTVRSRSISFNLQTHLATGLERLRMLKQDLMTTLRVPDVSLIRENGQLHLHITKPHDPPVSLLNLIPLLPHYPPTTAVLGLSEDNRPVLLNFTEQDVTHVLIAGMSGAGKTALLRTMVMSLAMTNRQSQVQFILLNAGGRAQATSVSTDLTPLNYLPHMLTETASSPEEMAHILTFLTEEVAYRSEQSVTTPTIIVVIDKIVRLLESSEPAVQNAVIQLAQRGAAVGIHLVLSTQHPQARQLNNLLKANLSIQIVGQVADEEAARAATGLSGTQAEYLLGQGDFLAVTPNQVTHFQAAYLSDYDLHLCLQELHKKRPPALLAQSIDVRTLMAPDLLVSPRFEETPQSFLFDGTAVSLEHGPTDYEACAETPTAPEGEDEANLAQPYAADTLNDMVTPTKTEAVIDTEAPSPLPVQLPPPVQKTWGIQINTPSSVRQHLAAESQVALPKEEELADEVLEDEAPAVVEGAAALSEADLEDEAPALTTEETEVEGTQSELDLLAFETILAMNTPSHTDDASLLDDLLSDDTQYEDIEDDWLPFDDDF